MVRSQSVGFDESQESDDTDDSQTRSFVKSQASDDTDISQNTAVDKSQGSNNIDDLQNASFNQSQGSMQFLGPNNGSVVASQHFLPDRKSGVSQSTLDSLENAAFALHQRVWPIRINEHKVERCEINENPLYICCHCDMGVLVENGDIRLANYFFGRLIEKRCVSQ